MRRCKTTEEADDSWANKMSLVVLQKRPPAPDELEKVVSFDQPSEGTSGIERFYADDQVLRKHIAVHEIWEHN